MALFFYLFLKWHLNRVDEMVEERKAAEAERIVEVKNFVKATQRFTVVMENHLHDNVQAMEKLCECIDHNTEAVGELVRK